MRPREQKKNRRSEDERFKGAEKLFGRCHCSDVDTNDFDWSISEIYLLGKSRISISETANQKERLPIPMDHQVAGVVEPAVKDFLCAANIARSDLYLLDARSTS